MRSHISKFLFPSVVCSLVAAAIALPADPVTRVLTEPVLGGFPKGPTKLKEKAPSDPTFKPPIVTVIKQEFPDARGWRIKWEGGSYTSETSQKVQSIFSTINGSVHSVHYLNNTSPGNTSNADMQLYFGDLKSTKQVSQLMNGTTRKTSFKLSGMTVAQLEDAAKNDPSKFTAVYTFGFDVASEVKDDYKAGQIYVFKTDRMPAKYGAVRIVSLNPRVIEVVVQK